MVALNVELGTVASGTHISVFCFRCTEPIAANNLESVENDEMCKDKKMSFSVCF